MPEADQPLAEIKVAKKERNNYYYYYFSSLTLYEPIYQHIFSLILSVTFYYDATRSSYLNNAWFYGLKNKLESVTSNVSSFGLFEVSYNTLSGRRESVVKQT